MKSSLHRLVYVLVFASLNFSLLPPSCMYIALCPNWLFVICEAFFLSPFLSSPFPSPQPISNVSPKCSQQEIISPSALSRGQPAACFCDKVLLDHSHAICLYVVYDG